MANKSFSKSIKKLSVLTIIGTLLALTLSSTGQKAFAFDLSTFPVVKKDSFFIGPGVNHSNYTLKSSTNIEAVNTLEVDPKNPYIKLAVTSPNNRVLSLDTVRNQANQINQNGYRVIAGFNSDFFKISSPYTGQPIGLQITNGEIITAPKTSKSVLSINQDGSTVIFNEVKMTSKLQITGVSGSKSLTGINRGRNQDTQNDSLFLFTSRFSHSTKTSGDEIEILLKPNKSKLVTNEVLSATVEEIEFENDSPIPDGKWILAASGSQAEWLIEKLDIGSEIKLQVNFSHGIDNSQYAVSGGDLIVQNGRPTSAAIKDTSGRHPRTMISTKQGKLYITTFDGRQRGYSDGVTLFEGANYLANNGMESTMNMDGGGSTTYAIRLPGEQALTVFNRPSDGNERRVANALMVVSTAPISEVATLAPSIGNSIKVLANTKIPITFKGLDKYYNGVKVDVNKVNWSIPAALGKVDQNGVFTAGTKAAKGKIIAKIGLATKSINVEVIDSLANLTISPKESLIIPGRKQAYTVKGFDSKGKEVILDQKRLKWETKGNIGKLDSKGTLASVNRIEKGKVIVSYGKTKVEATINVGKSPVVIEQFENLNNLHVTNARAISVKGSLAKGPKPVKVGNHSLALAYDFTATEGTSAAYINFTDKDGKSGRLIESKPSNLEIWVYGDAKNHWLRGALQDGSGRIITVDFTTQGKLDWKGWKKVYAKIPENTPTPIKLRQIYVVEPNNSNKNKGTLYFDHLRAIYTEVK